MRNRALLIAVFVMVVGLIGAQGDVVYSSIPSPLPGNVSSLGYEATSTSEFGNAVTLAGSVRHLTTIDVVMSDWAKLSSYPAYAGSTGFTHPLTLNLYNYGAGGAVGSLIGSRILDAFIPWRPEADPTCDGDRFRASNGTCYSGLATTVTFDFTPLNVTLPDTLIFGLSFNTSHHGDDPLMVVGPYDSLNFGAQGGALVGSNVYPSGAYLDSTWGGAYGDNGANGIGSFRLDATSWNGYSPEVRINADNDPPPTAAVPEPASMVLIGSGLAGMLSKLRKKPK